MWMSDLFGAYNIEIFELYGVSARTMGEDNFSRFCADVLYGRSRIISTGGFYYLIFQIFCFCGLARFLCKNSRAQKNQAKTIVNLHVLTDYKALMIKPSKACHI